MGERRHVHEADVVRVLTFACVIGVHTLSHSAPASSVSANGILMLLHFTREAQRTTHAHSKSCCSLDT